MSLDNASTPTWNKVSWAFPPRALAWTLRIKRQSGFVPVPVEQVLEQEFSRNAARLQP